MNLRHIEINFLACGNSLKHLRGLGVHLDGFMWAVVKWIVTIILFRSCKRNSLTKLRKNVS